MENDISIQEMVKLGKQFASFSKDRKIEDSKTKNSNDWNKYLLDISQCCISYFPVTLWSCIVYPEINLDVPCGEPTKAVLEMRIPDFAPFHFNLHSDFGKWHVEQKFILPTIMHASDGARYDFCYENIHTDNLCHALFYCNELAKKMQK